MKQDFQLYRPTQVLTNKIKKSSRALWNVRAFFITIKND